MTHARVVSEFGSEPLFSQVLVNPTDRVVCDNVMRLVLAQLDRSNHRMVEDSVTGHVIEVHGVLKPVSYKSLFLIHLQDTRLVTNVRLLPARVPVRGGGSVAAIDMRIEFMKHAAATIALDTSDTPSWVECDPIDALTDDAEDERPSDPDEMKLLGPEDCKVARRVIACVHDMHDDMPLIETSMRVIDDSYNLTFRGLDYVDSTFLGHAWSDTCNFVGSSIVSACKVDVRNGNGEVACDTVTLMLSVEIRKCHAPARYSYKRREYSAPSVAPPPPPPTTSVARAPFAPPNDPPKSYLDSLTTVVRNNHRFIGSDDLQTDVEFMTPTKRHASAVLLP